MLDDSIQQFFGPTLRKALPKQTSLNISGVSKVDKVKNYTSSIDKPVPTLSWTCYYNLKRTDRSVSSGFFRELWGSDQKYGSSPFFCLAKTAKQIMLRRNAKLSLSILQRPVVENRQCSCNDGIAGKVGYNIARRIKPFLAERIASGIKLKMLI